MILAYHRITDGDSGYLYSVTRDQLDAHLAVVAGMVEGARSPRVTFDDGHRSNYALGRDLLARRGVRAAFFVTAGWMGVRDGFMSWSDLRDLTALGHEVQAHGWAHRVLPECSPAELEEELGRAKRTIEDRLGSPVDAMSIPHGRWDDRVLGAAAAAGYRRVYTSNPWGRAHHREGLEVIGRYMVRRGLQAPQLRRLLVGDPRAVFVRRAQFRLKEALRRCIGETAYRRLWSAVAASEEAG